MDITLFEKTVGIVTLLLQGVSLFLILYLLFALKKKVKVAKQKVHLLIFLTLLFASIGSFIYSDYFHIEPCKLCWLQRVMLFPQLMLVTIAFFKKKIHHLYDELLIFSGGGFLLALYQIFEQFRAEENTSGFCLVGSQNACSQIHMLGFGYITFPVASATIFLFLLLLGWYAKTHFEKQPSRS